ncbi:MAG: glycosyltransferase [Bacteroidales bacterium]|nr:glycosyltransferase [Bacteroidales bacterium]
MKILFVLNNMYLRGNGLCASAQRTIDFLKKAGEDVRVLSGKNDDPNGPQPEFLLAEEMHIPPFDNLIHSQGYQFSKNDEKVIGEALRWADVVHLEEPFHVQWKVARMAKKMGVPCTATYHLHPENIFCNVKMDGWRFLNNATLMLARDVVYNYCTDIQCPTLNVLERLKAFNFKARLHLISNGLVPAETLRKKGTVKDPDAPWLVTCIGRLSNEKDQFTLLNSMKYSKFAKNIQLYFAGRGPEEQKIVALANKLYEDGVLAYRPIFAFHTIPELIELSSRSDLYIHCARVEVEGLSALEAMQQAVVPIIAEARLSATSQFALDSRSLFPVGNPRALAERIDYWLSNPEELERMRWEYAASVDKYKIDKSIAALIDMFHQAIGR